MRGEPIDHPEWPERRLFLPLLGGALGLVFHLLVDTGDFAFDWTKDPLRIAAACFVAVGGIAFAFTVERLRWIWSAAFGLAAGLIAGAIFYWNGGPGGYAGDEWQVIAIIVAIAIAAPLVQAARDDGRWSRDYAAIHAHAWGNIVLWFAAWGFVLVTYLLSLLLAELFSLIGIDLLKDLTREGWFSMMLIGGALGGAVAMLRDRDRILGMLQRVVMTILSVLAPALAAGLALFILALPFTGLGPLWDQTSATTPILLTCVIGAVILANAIIGNDTDEESRSRLLRVSALVLCLAIVPLAVVALISTGLRIDQHGFTPQRLWGLVFVGLALTVAAAYLLSVLFARRGWMAAIRTVNLGLAIMVCVVAALLATPLSNFGGISTRDQVARLRSGEVPPERFDWAALAFDFGPSGREALASFAMDGAPNIREPAAKALAAKQRWDLPQATPDDIEARESLDRRLVIRPVQVPIPDSLRSALVDPTRMAGGVCRGEGRCYLFWRPGERTAVAVNDPCGDQAQGSCFVQFATLEQRGADWVDVSTPADIVSGATDEEARTRRRRGAVQRGEVEVREVTRRQLFVGGEPVGAAFE